MTTIQISDLFPTCWFSLSPNCHKLLYHGFSQNCQLLVKSISPNFQDRSNSSKSANQKLIPQWNCCMIALFLEQNISNMQDSCLEFWAWTCFPGEDEKIGWRKLLASENYSETRTTYMNIYWLPLVWKNANQISLNFFQDTQILRFFQPKIDIKTICTTRHYIKQQEHTQHQKCQ